MHGGSAEPTTDRYPRSIVAFITSVAENSKNFAGYSSNKLLNAGRQIMVPHFRGVSFHVTIDCRRWFHFKNTGRQNKRKTEKNGDNSQCCAAIECRPAQTLQT